MLMKSRFDVLVEGLLGTIGNIAGMAAGVVPMIPGNTNVTGALSNVKNQLFGGNAYKDQDLLTKQPKTSTSNQSTPAQQANTVIDRTRVDKIAKGNIKARTPLFDKAPIQQGIANLISTYQRAKPNASVQEVQAHINAILNGIA